MCVCVYFITWLLALYNVTFHIYFSYQKDRFFIIKMLTFIKKASFTDAAIQRHIQLNIAIAVSFACPIHVHTPHTHTHTHAYIYICFYWPDKNFRHSHFILLKSSVEGSDWQTTFHRRLFPSRKARRYPWHAKQAERNIQNTTAAGAALIYKNPLSRANKGRGAKYLKLSAE